ncbi:MAG: hypothetical protein WD030_02715 [Pirellulales bacterium]
MPNHNLRRKKHRNLHNRNRLWQLFEFLAEGRLWRFRHELLWKKVANLGIKSIYVRHVAARPHEYAMPCHVALRLPKDNEPLSMLRRRLLGAAGDMAVGCAASLLWTGALANPIWF